MIDKKGKILSIVAGILIVTALIIIPLVFSADSGNTKVYNEDTKTVIIKDSSNNEISSIQLNTPLINYVPRGYQKVAEFTINNKEEYSNAINSMEFYDLNDNNQIVTRQFDYKVKGYETVTVNDYQNSCQEIWDEILQNNTQICEKTKIGSHLEQREIWTSLEKTSFNLGEILTIGIFTDVQKGDYIEWIPTFYGMKINEWASWNESLTVGLFSYYKLDETSGIVALDQRGLYNGTATTNNVFNGTISGISNSAANFTYYNDAITINNSLDGFVSMYRGGSVSLWTKADTIGSNLVVWEHPPGDQDRLGILTESGNNFKFGVGDEYLASNTTANAGQWYHLVLTWNGSRSKGYINGSLVMERNYIPSEFILSNHSYLGSRLTVLDYNGSVDEVGFWNRTLTQAEITDLYNNGNGITYGIQPENYTIRFNLTNSLTGIQIVTQGGNNFNISCDNGFTAIDVKNPFYGNNSFNGIVKCTFSDLNKYFNKNQTFTADSNKTVEIQMSPLSYLTQEEHDWLEAIYNCMINGVGCYS